MTTFTTGGYVLLDNVMFNGPGLPGEPNSSLSWTGLNSAALTDYDTDYDLVDGNSDGQFSAENAVDYFQSTALTFSGYSILSGGVGYPIFFTSQNGGVYLVPLPVDGTTQTIIPASGTSETYVALTSGNTYCFVDDTQIATPSGERSVQDLRIGDLVLTADGRAVPVKWLGQQRVAPLVANLPLDDSKLPVQIAAGTLGTHSDLLVSADHGMILGGCVVNAGALINGQTITRVTGRARHTPFHYWHIETESHEILRANGAAAESFIDYLGRQIFDNYEEYQAIYGGEARQDRGLTEMSLPRITAAVQLPRALRQSLLQPLAG